MTLPEQNEKQAVGKTWLDRWIAYLGRYPGIGTLFLMIFLTIISIETYWKTIPGYSFLSWYGISLHIVLILAGFIFYLFVLFISGLLSPDRQLLFNDGLSLVIVLLGQVATKSAPLSSRLLPALFLCVLIDLLIWVYNRARNKIATSSQGEK